ncbi:MAG: hypothetical protein ACI4VF_07695 [Lachnospirales bacterium]
MKKFIAFFMSFLILASTAISTFADDEIGGTFVVDFEDIISGSEDIFFEENEEVIEEVSEEVSEEIIEEITEIQEEITEETTLEETTEEITNISENNDLSEEESKLNEEIENNRTKTGSQSNNVVSEVTTVENESETTTDEALEITQIAANEQAVVAYADSDESNLITEYTWDLSKDRGTKESELGLTFTSDFSVGGSATVEGNKYETSIIAATNGGGIRFQPPVNGTFTIAYKVNNGKTANIFGTSAKNSTGASLYVQNEYSVSTGTSYEANVTGSKIQVYYLHFVADTPFDPSYTGVIEADFIPSDAEKWDFKNGLDTNRLYGVNSDNSTGTEYITAGEQMSVHSSQAGIYVQGTTNPVIKNRIPQSGAYITFHAETEGNLYVVAGIGSGKTANICNNDDYYNTDSGDMLIKDIFHIYSGEDYYIYSPNSKIKLYQLGFVSGGALAEGVKDSKVTEGIFTVEFDDESSIVQSNTFKGAIDAANGHKATITLNDNYYLTNADLPETYVLGNSSLKSLKLTNGSDITLVSNVNSIARYSIIRDIGNCDLENFICVGEGATLTIGRNSENSNREAIIFDGGFDYDVVDRKLIADESYKSKYGSFILMEGGSLYIGEKVAFVRNYSLGYNGDKVRTGDNDRCENTAVIDGNEKYNSTVYLDGIDVTQNFGSGLICANNSMKVTVNKADIYYNESYGDKTGALMVTQNKNNLIFTDNCDVQIRSNKNYYSTGEISPYLHDIYVGTTVLHSGDKENLGININGSLEVGEIHIEFESINNAKIFVLPTDKHKNTIAITTGASMNNYQNGGVFNMYVELTDDKLNNLTTPNRYNPNILIKGDGLLSDGVTKTYGYYKVKTKETLSDIKNTNHLDENEKPYIYFNNIDRDIMIYRENTDNEIGEDLARYGLVIVGAFRWAGGTEAESGELKETDIIAGNEKAYDGKSEAIKRNKYNLIGFDVVIQESDPNNGIESDSPKAYVAGDKAFRWGILWNGAAVKDNNDNHWYSDGAVIVNPVLGAADLANNHSSIINPDLAGNIADGYLAYFGSEIKNIPANVRFWIRKRFESDKVRDNTVEDYIPPQEGESLSPWVCIDTPSLYTTNITGYSL